MISKRRATGLLAAVTLLFIAVTVLGGTASWAGYLQATAAASMVGGVADWFAVTALFRHPLGLPIPHTAIVVERKNQFATTLGEFVQESFLTPEAIVERVRAAGVVARLADWLSEPANAARVAAEAADGAVAFADLLRDEDAHSLIEAVVRERIEAVPLAPLAGRALRFLTEGGRQDDLFDAGFRGLGRFLDEHREDLRQRLGERSPWWLPGAVEDRIFERLLDGVRAVLDDMARDRDHELRLALETRLAQLAADLETSPSLRAGGERVKHELLAQPQLRQWATVLWRDLKDQLRVQASDPDSELRRRLAGTISAAGSRLQEDPVLGATVQMGVESAASYVAEHFDGEIAALISSTIARWDAEETGRRLELLLGPDLQYIRINGTVVGAAAGLLLHAIAQAIG